MKNYEKYADKIKAYTNDSSYCEEIIIPNVLKPLGKSCVDTSCDVCNSLTILWLMEEYEEPKEPETDWSKVKVDTPILVKNSEDKMWRKRHFAKYKNGNVYAWSDGLTSWTAYDMMVWKCAKLAEDEGECEEPKVDWNEVKIDTPILVRDSENGDWFKRYFAEYKNGKIYTWDNGHTSWETSRMIEWKYAKLVEDEE